MNAVNHETVYRNREKPYDCPMDEDWVYFVTNSPAVWIGNSLMRMKFANMYGMAALEQAKRNLVPENMDSSWVGVVTWGGKREPDPVSSIPAVGISQADQVILATLEAVLRKLESIESKL